MGTMVRLAKWFDAFSQELAVRTVRWSQKSVPKMMLDDLFLSLLRSARHPFERFYKTRWCEVWYDNRDCALPDGMGSCHHCHPHYPCPRGYRPSYAYNYPTTGCWCVATASNVTKVCCDCTLIWNDPHQRHANDCQCQHFVS